MGRMDIDYAVLEDAFLRYQTKPKLSMHGDLYYEARKRYTICIHTHTHAWEGRGWERKTPLSVSCV